MLRKTNVHVFLAFTPLCLQYGARIFLEAADTSAFRITASDERCFVQSSPHNGGRLHSAVRRVCGDVPQRVAAQAAHARRSSAELRSLTCVRRAPAQWCADTSGRTQPLLVLRQHLANGRRTSHAPRRRPHAGECCRAEHDADAAGARLVVVTSDTKIFNPEAYCEICNKEFCNKYFLKTHKANKHGIAGSSDEQHAGVDPTSPSSGDAGGGEHFHRQMSALLANPSPPPQIHAEIAPAAPSQSNRRICPSAVGTTASAVWAAATQPARLAVHYTCQQSSSTSRTFRPAVVPPRRCSRRSSKRAIWRAPSSPSIASSDNHSRRCRR